jgi:CO/xanthine dehydrogenase FAD-binding subunit
MVRYDYIRSHSIAETIDYLNDPRHTSLVLAGGTDLLVAIRKSVPWFDRVIDISQIPELKVIEQQDDFVIVGSGVTFNQAAESETLHYIAPLLAEACQSVGSLQIRNLGTLGGNVVNAAACADSLPPLISLDATVHLQTAGSKRQISVKEFVIGPNKTDLKAGELLTYFTFRVPPEGFRSAFIKLGRRNAQSISRLSMATIGRTNNIGVVDYMRLTPGAATPYPMRVESAEQMLIDQIPTEELLIEAGKKVAKFMIETTGIRWSSMYKEPAIQALTERALRRVFPI